MKTHICPDHIVYLFRDQATVMKGRKLSVAWLKGQFPQIVKGDQVLIPVKRGELKSFTYGGLGGLQ